MKKNLLVKILKWFIIFIIGFSVGFFTFSYYDKHQTNVDKNNISLNNKLESDSIRLQVTKIEQKKIDGKEKHIYTFKTTDEDFEITLLTRTYIMQLDEEIKDVEIGDFFTANKNYYSVESDKENLNLYYIKKEYIQSIEIPYLNIKNDYYKNYEEIKEEFDKDVLAHESITKTLH